MSTTSAQSTSPPPPEGDRIRLIDALRGFSLLGIVVVHFAEQFLGFMPPLDHREYSQHGAVDKVLETLVFLLIRGKGFALFSFMFGLSFALQMQRAAPRSPGRDFRWRLAWRLAILFGIGVVHSLLYSGDILMIYATLGLPLLLFYRVPDRWLWTVAVILLLGAPRVVMRYATPSSTSASRQAQQTALEEQAVRHYEVLAKGALPDVMRRTSWEALPLRLEFQFGAFARAYQTFGYFLLGLWAGRRRLFEHVEAHVAAFRRAFRWALAVTLALPLIAGVLAFLASRGGGGASASQDSSGGLQDFTSWPMIAGMGAYDIWNFAMTACYVTLFTLLYLRPRWQNRLAIFVPVGRMALTAYVAQTLAGTLIFFGIGLGLLGRVGNSVAIPLALFVFAIEIAVSRWWLQRFLFGPLEWLWRSLTYLRPQPFLRARASS